MGMTIDTIIKDCEQIIKQSELFIKAHQKNMEIGEIKEYQYYIKRNKLIIKTMRKYQKIAEIADEWEHDHDNLNYADDSYYWSKVREVLEDGNDT